MRLLCSSSPVFFGGLFFSDVYTLEFLPTVRTRVRARPGCPARRVLAGLRPSFIVQMSSRTPGQYWAFNVRVQSFAFQTKVLFLIFVSSSGQSVPVCASADVFDRNYPGVGTYLLLVETFARFVTTPTSDDRLPRLLRTMDGPPSHHVYRTSSPIILHRSVFICACAILFYLVLLSLFPSCNCT